jgi:transcriptional regulator with XRE-family HTH domain
VTATAGSVNLKDLSHRLKRIMEARGIRPIEMHRLMRIQVSKTLVYMWLDGKSRPQPDAIKEMARVLDVPLEILLGAHVIRWHGTIGGDIIGHCDDCDSNQRLGGNRYTDEDLARFQNMHWGIEPL